MKKTLEEIKKGKSRLHRLMHLFGWNKYGLETHYKNKQPVACFRCSCGEYMANN